jgi:S1-C subfamily serine protease
VEGAKVIIDEKEAGITPLTIKLDRNSDHEIKLEHEGYKSAEYSVYRVMNFDALWWSMVPLAVMTGGLPFLEDYNLYFASIAGGAAGSLLEFIVDQNTGATHNFRKTDIAVKLVEIPPMMVREECLPFHCDLVNIKIPTGTPIGIRKDFKDKPYDKIYWQSTVNVGVDELIVLVNNNLYDLGFNITGFKNTSHQKSHFTLSAQINEIDYTISNKYAETRCELAVLWELYRGNTVVFSKESPGISRKQVFGNESVVFFDAFNNALINLLNEGEIYEIVKIGRQEESVISTSNDSAFLQINTPKNEYGGLSKLVESVVTIQTDISQGTGFIISEDGYLLTNYHVIEGFDDVNIIFSNGFSFIAKVIRVSEDRDLALLKIDGKGFKPLILVNSDSLDLGEDVVAIGTPADINYSQTITKGIVSGNRLLEGKKYIQTDVSISPGNSGGPLVNSKGEVVGVITAKVVGEGIEGIGFAIPTNDVFSELKIQYR